MPCVHIVGGVRPQPFYNILVGNTVATGNGHYVLALVSANPFETTMVLLLLQ